MIRAVLDANVLVSGLPAASGTLADLIDQWRAGRLRLVVSQHIIDEVSRAWIKPYWWARFSPTQVARADAPAAGGRRGLDDRSEHGNRDGRCWLAH